MTNAAHTKIGPHGIHHTVAFDESKVHPIKMRIIRVPKKKRAAKNAKKDATVKKGALSDEE